MRWGIIGCGDVCEVKSGPGFQKAEGSPWWRSCAATATRPPTLPAATACPGHYDDAAALIADPEVDAVYIATPPSSHARYTLHGGGRGQAGLRRKADGHHRRRRPGMIAACRAAAVPLFVAYYRRALPRFQRVKALLAEGAIGTPCAVNMVLCRAAACRAPAARRRPPGAWIPAIAGAGLFLDLGSHMLDLLDHLLGPIIAAARGAAANRAGLYAAEDTRQRPAQLRQRA